MQAKKYQFSNLAPELSVKLFEEHWKLYEGYVSRLNEALARLSNPYDMEVQRSVNPASGIFRDVEKDKSFLLNAVMLHELFFENVILPHNSGPMPIGPEFLSLVQQYFPQVKSNDFWSHIVKPTSKAARGWAVVGWSTLLGTMDVCMMDDHGGSLPVGLYPLLVIDVYEHAYMGQFGIDRGTYLDSIFRSINWNVVEHRVAKIHSASELMRTSVPDEAEEYIRKASDSGNDTDFGFPDEDYFPDGQSPKSTGLDHRSELAVQPNPRGVQGAAPSASPNVDASAFAEADIDEAYTRITCLAKITFSDTDDLFDKEAKGKSSEFREALWARLQEDEGTR